MPGEMLMFPHDLVTLGTAPWGYSHSGLIGVSFFSSHSKLVLVRIRCPSLGTFCLAEYDEEHAWHLR